MFKKLKQRIEEGEQPTGSSTPRSPPPSTTNNKLRKENKWEKRRLSNGSIYSSRDSLVSIDSGATVSRLSVNGSLKSMPSVDTPALLSTLRDNATKEQILAELSTKCNNNRKLEGKISEMASAFAEQSRQKERLEDALQSLRSEINQRLHNSNDGYTNQLEKMKQSYEERLQEKDHEIMSILEEKNQNTDRIVDVQDRNQLQQEEIARMRSMLIQSQSEMTRKASEIMQKSQIDNLDKQYERQSKDLNHLEERLESLKRERTKQEAYGQQLLSQVTSLEEQKNNMQKRLDDAMAELTEKSVRLSKVEQSLSRCEEELNSVKQTYNFYKTKAASEIEQKSSENAILKERAKDLQQRLEDSRLSGDDQSKAMDKERMLLETRLQEAREQLIEAKTQSKDKVNTLGSLVSSLDERLKEKEEEVHIIKEKSDDQERTLNKTISDLKSKLSTLEIQSTNSDNSKWRDESRYEKLESTIKDLESSLSEVKDKNMELEVIADRSNFLEDRNEELEAALKQEREIRDSEKRQKEEKIRELQSETRKMTYRLERSTKTKVDNLETKVEEQERHIEQYQERLEQLTMDKDQLHAELSMKEEECLQASLCLEDAMTRTNELKGEIATLEDALRQKDDLLIRIKTTDVDQDEFTEEADRNDLIRQCNDKEHALLERDEEISELRHLLSEREQELLLCNDKISAFEENNRNVPPNQLHNILDPSTNHKKELQKTVARLSTRVQELENQLTASEPQHLVIENEALTNELESANKKLKAQQQKFTDLKKAFQKELRLNVNGETCHSESSQCSDDQSTPGSPFSNDNERADYLQTNFKYLKHVVLKYMCGSNDQSRQLLGVIAHLLQFTPREEAIVRDCLVWKLPVT